MLLTLYAVHGVASKRTCFPAYTQASIIDITAWRNVIRPIMREVAVQININTLLPATKLQFLTRTANLDCYFYKDTNFIPRITEDRREIVIIT